MARRSLLYSPGDDRAMMEKALETEADTVIFDLEDAVAPSAKADARAEVTSLLDALSDPEPSVSVRINPFDRTGPADVDAIVDADTTPDSIVLPKVESPATVAALHDRLDDADADEIDIIPLVETAAGIVAVEEIAAAPGVVAVAYGDQDFTADIGATVTDEKTESLYAQQRVVVAATAAGVDALDTVFTDFEDHDGLRERTEFVITLGFDGKLAIHPSQVAVINDAFTPSDEQLEWADRVLTEHESAAEGEEAVVTVDGQMIDAPLVERAKTIRERASAAGIR